MFFFLFFLVRDTGHSALRPVWTICFLKTILVDRNNTD